MIFIGADHRGRALLENLTRNLAGLELDYKIIGEEFYSDEDDYTDFAKEVALKILGNLDENLNESFGILLCGSGQGVAIGCKNGVDQFLGGGFPIRTSDGDHREVEVPPMILGKVLQSRKYVRH